MSPGFDIESFLRHATALAVRCLSVARRSWRRAPRDCALGLAVPPLLHLCSGTPLVRGLELRCSSGCLPAAGYGSLLRRRQPLPVRPGDDSATCRTEPIVRPSRRSARSMNDRDSLQQPIFSGVRWTSPVLFSFCGAAVALHRQPAAPANGRLSIPRRLCFGGCAGGSARVSLPTSDRIPFGLRLFLAAAFRVFPLALGSRPPPRSSCCWKTRGPAPVLFEKPGGWILLQIIVGAERCRFARRQASFRACPNDKNTRARFFMRRKGPTNFVAHRATKDRGLGDKAGDKDGCQRDKVNDKFGKLCRPTTKFCRWATKFAKFVVTLSRPLSPALSSPSLSFVAQGATKFFRALFSKESRAAFLSSKNQANREFS